MKKGNTSFVGQHPSQGINEISAVKKGNTSFVGQNPSTGSETTSAWLEA
ncbi:hypothetical protein HanIR_Chr08g0348981 [Helianthus annuus]|nr:hypothetical protein HanIR_Chr08g0348981 [Helianthus annuus]